MSRRPSQALGRPEGPRHLFPSYLSATRLHHLPNYED